MWHNYQFKNNIINILKSEFFSNIKFTHNIFFDKNKKENLEKKEIYKKRVVDFFLWDVIINQFF